MLHATHVTSNNAKRQTTHSICLCVLVVCQLHPNMRLVHCGFETKRDACRLLQQVGLEEKQLYRRASELSGGQQQRVAIARAFISQPNLVLADEPVASLDPAMSRSVLENLKQAARIHNVTVVCTLHQMEYALEFGDRIVALRQGEVFFDGCPNAMDSRTQAELYKLAKMPTMTSSELAPVAA